MKVVKMPRPPRDVHQVVAGVLRVLAVLSAVLDDSELELTDDEKRLLADACRPLMAAAFDNDPPERALAAALAEITRLEKKIEKAREAGAALSAVASALVVRQRRLVLVDTWRRVKP